MKTNMLSLHAPTTPGWCQKVIFFFSKSGQIANQIKVEEVQTYMQGNTLNLHIPLTSWARLKGQILKLCRCKYIFFIKLSTKTYLTCMCYGLNDTEGELRVGEIGFMFCDVHVSLK